MTSRSRILLTTLAFCHVLLWPGLFTTQLQAQASSTPTATESLASDAASSAAASAPESDAADPPPAGPAVPGEPVTLRAKEQEKVGAIYYLRGNAEIDYRNYIFRGDYVTYNSDTGDVFAKGHLLLSGGPYDEHIEADRGTYNINTDRGRLYNVRGTIGLRMKGSTIILTSSTPFSFTGRVAELEGREKIIVHHGMVTSCKMPDPHWELRTHKAVVVTGKDAKTYNTTFLLFRVPIFYFPFLDHAVTREARKSGFLMPEAGQSTIKGTIFGDAFYWAINRSYDATVGLESYSSRGWAERTSFRARPTDQAFINFSSYSVQDNQNEGGTEARLDAVSAFPYGFRGVANIDYLTSMLFREEWADTFALAIYSEVPSIAFLSRNDNGYSFNLMGARYQDYWNISPPDVITIEHTPSLESSNAERSIGDSHFLWSYEGALDGLDRSETGFHTGVVGRIDGSPYLTAPVQWHGWSLRPQVAVRETFYTSQLSPAAEASATLPEAVNRHAVEASFELRPPAISRTFEKPVFGHTMKHVVEPRMIYHEVSGINNFDQIIRFDERDILTDTNELEYGFTNRFYLKNRPKKNCPPPAPEKKPESNMAPLPSPAPVSGLPPMSTPITGASGAPAVTPPAPPSASNCQNPTSYEFASWDLSQKYFFDPYFGGALVPGARNVFTTTVDLTGWAFLTSPRLFSPVVSRLRMRAGGTDIEWHLDYDTVLGRINGSTVFVNKHLFTNFSFAAGQSYLHEAGTEVVSPSTIAPIPMFNQFRLQLQYGAPTKKGFNAAGSVGYDTVQNIYQYTQFQTTYNWDCCGMTFEYRRFNLITRNESEYRFALTLTNVGTFGNLRRQERLF